MLKEYKEVCFYNWFGNGDLFTARQFVKDIMSIIPAERYSFAHGKNPRMFDDIPNLHYSKVYDFMRNDAPFVEGQADDLYINTWIGRDSKYVLPGVGCVLYKFYEMFNDSLAPLGIKLSQPLGYYIPRIDYSYFQCAGVNDFVFNCKFDRKVLISNGPVQSNQAENFDFTAPIVNWCENFPDIAFIITEPIPYTYENLFFTKDVTKTDDGFDLNEISYLSLYTDTIIGRSSGPYVFTQVLDNYMNEEKHMMSFCYSINALDFVGNSQIPLKLKRYWSNTTKPEEVFISVGRILQGL